MAGICPFSFLVQDNKDVMQTDSLEQSEWTVKIQNSYGCTVSESRWSVNLFKVPFLEVIFNIP